MGPFGLSPRTTKLSLALLSLAALFPLALPPLPQGGQASVIRHGASLPSVCNANQDVFIRDGVGPHWCSAANTWSIITPPSGFIGLIDTGSCPAGYTEVAAFNGRSLLATLNANANIGTTGGADNITPAVTNSMPVFTGSTSDTTSVTAGTPGGTNTAPTFTGDAASTVTVSADTSGATATVVSGPYRPTGTVGAPIFSGTTMTAHFHATTANGTVSAPILSGTTFDNRDRKS